MPTVFRALGYRFFFYSNEGNPREPVHVHARGNGGEAKLWVEPDVSIAYSKGLTARQLRELAEITRTRSAEISEAWHGHFG